MIYYDNGEVAAGAVISIKAQTKHASVFIVF